MDWDPSIQMCSCRRLDQRCPRLQDCTLFCRFEREASEAVLTKQLMRLQGFIASRRDAHDKVPFLVHCEQFRMPKLFRVCGLRFCTQDFVVFCCSIEGECRVYS